MAFFPSYPISTVTGNFLPLTGGKLTGPLTIDAPAGTSSLNLTNGLINPANVSQLNGTIAVERIALKTIPINFLTTGTYNLITIPTGFNFVCDTFVFVPTSIVNQTSTFSFNVGDTTNGTTFYETNLQAATGNNVFVDYFVAGSGLTITFTISTAAVATTCNGFFIFNGYLIPE